MRDAILSSIVQVLRFIPPPAPDWLMLALLVCACARGCA